MRTLYHLPLSPYCRKVRIALKEKGLDFVLIEEHVWDRRDEFMALNPAAKVPVLIEHDGAVLCESEAICEYLDEVYPGRPLFGASPGARAETRRLVSWFDLKFGHEVSANLIGEKVMRRLVDGASPDTDLLRAGQYNLRIHLEYIGFLFEHRNWLAGDELSLADIAAAAHLSSIDYLGDVPWDEFPLARDWYAKMKSQPSFRPLLADRVPGFIPARHYANLDF